MRKEVRHLLGGYFRILVLTLVCNLGISSTVLAAPSAKELNESYKFIDQAFNYIQKEALEEKTTVELVNASLDGLTLFLEGKKLDASFIKHAPNDATDKQAKELLRKTLVKAANTYPKLYEKQRLTMEAVQGAMKSIDPYTIYLDPEAYKSLQDTMAGGNFGGVGAVISKDKESGYLIVVEPMPDTPAMRANIRAKDRIIKIDDTIAKDLTVQDASKMLRGEPGTTVVVTIQRGNDEHTFEVPLKREKIHVHTATGKLLEEQNHKIGYIDLSIFGEGSNREVESLIRDFEKKGAEAFILDVRGNAGGYVIAAIDICSKFLPPGQRVTSINPRVGEENVRVSRPTGKRRNQPLVVLVDEHSASASEITAGCMKDWKRGTLIGVKTFGKGSVQNVFPIRFPDKESSAFKITIAHYHTPLGHDINKTGITPDIEVKLPDEPVAPDKNDAQKQAAIDFLVKQLNENAKPAESQAQANSTASDLIPAGSMAEENAYISERLGGINYTVSERKTERHGDTITETVTVKTAAGNSRVFKFDISSVLVL